MSTNYPSVDRRLVRERRNQAQLDQPARGTRFGCGGATFIRSSDRMIEPESNPAPIQRTPRQPRSSSRLQRIARDARTHDRQPWRHGASAWRVRRARPPFAVGAVGSPSRRDVAVERPPETSAIESVAFEVPGPSPKTRGVLEATFDPDCRPGEWDIQMLGMAANLGALLLEIERSHLQLTRSEFAGAKAKPDGAAPLIGSTSAMEALRSSIERVAVTDLLCCWKARVASGRNWSRARFTN